MNIKINYYNDAIDLMLTTSMLTCIYIKDATVGDLTLKGAIKDLLLTRRDIDSLQSMCDILVNDDSIVMLASRIDDGELRLLDAEEIEQLSEAQVKWLQQWQLPDTRSLSDLKFIGFFKPNIVFALPLYALRDLLPYMHCGLRLHEYQ